MKNYYQSLNLQIGATPQDLIQRLEDLQESAPDVVTESTAILLNNRRRTEYDLVHAQYQAINLVYQAIGEENILDTSNWSGRLATFNGADKS